ncbi:flagellar protein FlaG [Schinkia sp. CFF1]
MEIDHVLSNSYSPSIKSQNFDKNSSGFNREHTGIKTIQQDIKVKDPSKDVDDKVTKENLEEVIKGMNQFLSPTNTSLKFKLHEDLQEYYVEIVDESTKEVIREIPSKKMLDMYAAMRDFLGLVVDRKI